MLLNSTLLIKIPGTLINAELTSPSMLIGREVSETQRPMVIGETIGWKAHATETSEQSMECRSDARALDVAKSSFK